MVDMGITVCPICQHELEREIDTLDHAIVGDGSSCTNCDYFRWYDTGTYCVGFGGYRWMWTYKTESSQVERTEIEIQEMIKNAVPSFGLMWVELPFEEEDDIPF